MTSVEHWRQIAGYPAYQVSDFGRIKRLAVPDSIGRLRKENILSGIPHSGGVIVELYHNGIGKQFAIHILVLTAFVRPPENDDWGLHRDDDFTNNVVSNLYWGTRKDNAQDAIRNGRIGVGSPASKKVSDANVGRIHTAESRANMSSARRGKKLSDDHRKAIGQGQIGKKCPGNVSRNKAMIWTPEMRAKIAESNRRRSGVNQ